MQTRFKGEVIETYENGTAAVRFSYRNHDRVECVKYTPPTGERLQVGQRGWMRYHFNPSIGGFWGFELFKNERGGAA